MSTLTGKIAIVTGASRGIGRAIATQLAGSGAVVVCVARGENAAATVEAINAVDHDKALALYKDRFADAGTFTFIFVGNIDPAKLQPLVETYLGSLPSKGRKEKWKDIGIKWPTKKVTKTIEELPLPKLINLLTDLKEERDVCAKNSWVLQPMVKIIGELEASLKKYPPIKVGTPDPYTPPKE